MWSIPVSYILILLVQLPSDAFENNFISHRHHKRHVFCKREFQFFRRLSLHDQDDKVRIRKDLVTNNGRRMGFYSLGLRPFLGVKTNATTEVTSLEEDNQNVENFLQETIKDLESKDNSLPTKEMEECNTTLIAEIGDTAGIHSSEETTKENIPFNATKSNEQQYISDDRHSLSDSKIEKGDVKTEKSKNVLTDTISQSFQFFEDLPKRQGGSRSKKKGDPSESQTNSFRLFDNSKSDHLLPPSNDANGTLDASKPLTLADLQNILQQNGYIRRDEVSTMFSSPEATQYNVTTTVKKTKSGVAFPQPTALSNKHIKIGSMISSGFFGLLLAISFRPNLWLMGAVLGALYGGNIAEKAAEQSNTMTVSTVDGIVVPAPTTSPIPGGLYGELTLKSGKKIATTYLQVWDLFQGIWFMYRTGQLSYEYYRTYAALDKRFGIQTKMDAWNARFIEGKENFDRWEKENEIGRKVLAGLRTAWMVEESSYKKQSYLKRGKKRSKYRLIQVGIDVMDWFKRLFHALWGLVRGGDSKELSEITKGIRVGFQELNLEVVSQRTGAAIGALVAVNLIGAMFAVAPYLLGVTAIISGVIWPNWMGNTAKVIKEVIDETRARGRGEQIMKEQKQKKEKLPFVDKKSFHFYVGKDGKKKWYRTGQSYK